MGDGSEHRCHGKQRLVREKKMMGIRETANELLKRKPRIGMHYEELQEYLVWMCRDFCGECFQGQDRLAVFDLRCLFGTILPSVRHTQLLSR